MEPNKLLEDGWTRVDLEKNAYTVDHFEKKGWDVDSIAEFLDEEVRNYKLVELSKSHDYDFALYREEQIDGS